MNVYNIAGMNIGIDAKCEYTYKKCSCYRPNRAIPEFIASATPEQVKAEQKISDGSYEYCEFICIYREICSVLPMYDRLLLHSAVIEKDGFAYAFAAKSGTGKTTHIMQWKKLYGDSVNIINGDKPIFGFEDNKVIAYGTPWCGKEGLHSNTQAELKALCFIERAEQNVISEITKEEAINRIFKQIFIPKNKTAAAKTLELVSKLIENVKLYKLGCNISTDAAELAYNTMSNS